MAQATVTLGPRGVARLRAAHPWVRREDVLRGPDSDDDVVRLCDARGAHLGTALWANHSPVAARVFDRGEVAFDAALLDARIEAALARRQALMPDADAYRVVHGEADLLPGLFVDRYADVAVVQSLCAAMDRREALIAERVAARLGVRLVVARNDGAARDYEGLPRRRGALLGTGTTRVRFHDAGSCCEADVLHDGKTGSFLDQQDNHARAAAYVRPAMTALDAFSYHGGFALALARRGAHVLALDETAQAVAQATANATLNGVSHLLQARCDNAFDALRRLEGAGERFDVVVLDPPALAKRKGALTAAERAYKELNLRALRLVNPGGLVITCSCSGKLTLDRFAQVLLDAARDVGRPVQVLERRGASGDHPPLLQVPETDYLKCWILRVL